MNNLFLPTSVKEVEKLQWDYIDIILISGDAYIDHPAFGIAVIGRILESEGYRVAIIPQPNWRDDLRDFKKLGTPRLFFGVTAGNMDSMVNKYTANKRLRSDDAYTPDGRADLRPEYATETYCKILKQLYPKTPIIIGGIEASMRRFTHYDYWQDKLLPSILATTHADFLVYGMGEKPIVEIARHLALQTPIKTIQENVKQVVYRTATLPQSNHVVKLHSYETCLLSKQKFADNFRLIEENANYQTKNIIAESYNNQYIVANPPLEYTTQDLNHTYTLPYSRLPHFRYKEKPIAAFTMIQNSIQLHRGCFGGCSFCAIAMHQGKQIVSRSADNILEELQKVSTMPYFKGTVSDLGGPTANMYQMKGKESDLCSCCKRPSCIYPSICKNLDISHQPLLDLYQQARNMDGIKRIYIGSGIRYDLFLNEKGFLSDEARQYFVTLLQHHTSGRLKVAPEHSEEKVLSLMRKPAFALFEKLKSLFDQEIHRLNLRLQLIPYFISSHPNCGVTEMSALRQKTAKMGYRLEQVQDFTPTPMTLSSVIFYTGIDPYSGKKVFVERILANKKQQFKQFFRE